MTLDSPVWFSPRHIALRMSCDNLTHCRSHSVCRSTKSACLSVCRLVSWLVSQSFCLSAGCQYIYLFVSLSAVYLSVYTSASLSNDSTFCIAICLSQILVNFPTTGVLRTKREIRFLEDQIICWLFLYAERECRRVISFLGGDK